MDELAGLPPHAFDKADRAPDALFYGQPRMVTHIDAAAVASVTALYREMLPAGGAVLDLMSSWVSHLPPDIQYREVVGHGMNAAELAANPRLAAWFVQDLNADPILRLADARFDAACLCVSVQYLQRPVAMFREVRRVLTPGAPFVVSFSNRCFPTKAVAIWQALDGEEQQRLVSVYMARAGFDPIETGAVLPERGDPIRAVIGRAA